MINHWFASRPKRKLVSITEVIGVAVDVSLSQQWEGQVNTHLSMEEALEHHGLKRVGDRRDQGGSGARTYMAWLKSLGLVFKQRTTGKLFLTLAGEALINGDPPVPVLTQQLLKYQFPSAYSIGSHVNVAPRFKIHPVWFLLRLLRDERICCELTQAEIAKIVINEAENEKEECYNKVVDRIIQYRTDGDAILADDFEEIYGSDGSLNDVANTFINWLEYTQYIYREDGVIRILPEKITEVDAIVSRKIPFIDRPAEEEYFQRKYGIDPAHDKDTRNLSATTTITPAVVAQRKIKSAFIAYAANTPVFAINDTIINAIGTSTGFAANVVEEVLRDNFPSGFIGGFMTNYFEMAFKGRDEATDFEKATNEIFKNVFGFESHHVGPIGLTPDVLVISDDAGYQGIIDNKAYSRYSISNDHHNRMVHNYIRNISSYSQSQLPVGFFSYIAGGFTNGIQGQLTKITEETNVHGSAIPVSNIIKMIEKHQETPYTHGDLLRIMSSGRQVLLTDL